MKKLIESAGNNTIFGRTAAGISRLVQIVLGVNENFASEACRVLNANIKNKLPIIYANIRV